jgi:sugar fermentation stimulation protein A
VFRRSPFGKIDKSKVSKVSAHMDILYKFPEPFVRATITSRPSKYNKSPYLVDCVLEDGEEAIVHNPALKCNGLVEPGATVWLQPAGSTKSLSKYVLYLLDIEGVLVCIHPTIANEVCEGLICRGLVAPFIEKVKREVGLGDCRFDFYGLTGGQDTYIEVKSASMADTVNCMPGCRAAALADLGQEAPLMAIFPYGNRQKNGLVSERALKHVQGLAAAVAIGVRAHLVYISMRPDVQALKVSELDVVYRRAVFDAQAAGVRVVAVSVEWNTEGECRFVRKLELL